MAVLGHSKLEAVNQMLAALGLLPVSAISGNDEAERAEQFLNHWTRQVQTEGYAGNMRHKTYAAGTNVTVGSDVLRVECVAPGRYAGNIELKEDKLHCVTEDSNVIAADVHCHIWVEMTWEQCPPSLKDRILSFATQDYVARVKQRPDLMAVLEKQAQMSDVLSERPALRTEGIPPNTQPTSIRTVSRGGGSPE